MSKTVRQIFYEHELTKFYGSLNTAQRKIVAELADNHGTILMEIEPGFGGSKRLKFLYNADRVHFAEPTIMLLEQLGNGLKIHLDRSWIDVDVAGTGATLR